MTRMVVRRYMYNSRKRIQGQSVMHIINEKREQTKTVCYPLQCRECDACFMQKIAYVLQENPQKSAATSAALFWLKYAPNRLSVLASPQTRWGTHRVSSDSLAVFVSK